MLMMYMVLCMMMYIKNTAATMPMITPVPNLVVVVVVVAVVVASSGMMAVKQKLRH